MFKLWHLKTLHVRNAPVVPLLFDEEGNTMVNANTVKKRSFEAANDFAASMSEIVKLEGSQLKPSIDLLIIGSLNYQERWGTLFDVRYSQLPLHPPREDGIAEPHFFGIDYAQSVRLGRYAPIVKDILDIGRDKCSDDECEKDKWEKVRSYSHHLRVLDSYWLM